MNVYFDNAATTPMDKTVLEKMLPYLEYGFGNPSSTHSYGRKAKAYVETARKLIAKQINAAPNEIIFTSGGFFSCKRYFSLGKILLYLKGKVLVKEVNLFISPYFSLIGYLGNS